MSYLPTPTDNSLPLKTSGYRSLAEALDYASRGTTGCNFHNGRGELTFSMTYAELRERAIDVAHRLAGLGLQRGSRVALVADTQPDFHVMFFACQYAGLVPVPLPAAVHLGGKAAFITHLRALLRDCRAQAAYASAQFVAFLDEAVVGLDLAVSGTLENFLALEPADTLPEPPQPEDLAYLQYTSGSTRFPRGTDHAAGGTVKPGRDPAVRSPDPAWRPLLLVAAVLSRHGAGRTDPRPGGVAAVGGLSRHS